MKRRFASSSGSTSFFAFQDIITAVTGIMVLIALLMALQLTSGTPIKPRIDTKLSELHAHLSEQRDKLRAKIAAVAATAKPATQTVDNVQALLQVRWPLTTVRARIGFMIMSGHRPCASSTTNGPPLGIKLKCPSLHSYSRL